MKFIFWASISFLIYTYIGYPLLLSFLSKIKRKKVNKKNLDYTPALTIILTVFNEEDNIKKRIDNLFQLNYPKEKMQIVVVSDGSSDNTNEIVNNIILKKNKNLSTPGFKIELIIIKNNMGKPNALNTGMLHAEGDFIVFADARQEFLPNAINELLANFNDEEVGCVSGELKFRKNSKSNIEEEIDYYWNMEKMIRKMESDICSVIGATGCIYAIRKELYMNLLHETILDDVFTPMQIAMKGYRVIFESKAIAIDDVSKDYQKEKKRKIRTLVGNYQLVCLLPSLINPFKNRLFFMYISHKIFRLFIPFSFLFIIAGSFFINGIIYNFFLLSILFLILILIAGNRIKRFKILWKINKIVKAILMLNYFALLSAFLFFSNRYKNIW